MKPDDLDKILEEADWNAIEPLRDVIPLLKNLWVAAKPWGHAPASKSQGGGECCCDLCLALLELRDA